MTEGPWGVEIIAKMLSGFFLGSSLFAIYLFFIYDTEEYGFISNDGKLLFIFVGGFVIATLSMIGHRFDWWWGDV